MLKIARGFASFLAFAVCAVTPADAQEFPNRVVRLVVANPAGTSADLIARAIAPEMAKVLGQAVIVENKVGAAQQIGYHHVAKQAPADGHTIAVVIIPSLISLPVALKEPGFDPLTDLQPIIGIGEARLTLVSSSSLPWKSFKEMAAAARSNPGKLNYGSSGMTSRVMGEVLNRDFGSSMVHIPYKSVGPFVQALLVSEVAVGFLGEADIASYGDRLTVLGISGGTRSMKHPAVPTFAELGFPQIGGISYSLNVRADTPKGIRDRIHGAALLALQQPSVKALFAKFELDITPEAPDLVEKKMVALGKLFAEIAKSSGIEPQ